VVAKFCGAGCRIPWLLNCRHWLAHTGPHTFRNLLKFFIAHLSLPSLMSANLYLA
jgi:hypothetical protein